MNAKNKGLALISLGAFLMIPATLFWMSWRIHADTGNWWEAPLAVSGIDAIVALCGTAILFGAHLGDKR